MHTSPLDVADKSRAGSAPPSSVQAREFVRRMRGASQPWLVRCDDGQFYVVKFRNNPQNPRVLANEMLAARLAHLMGLPVATPSFIEVPSRLINGNPHLTFDLGERCEAIKPGVQFGSRFPGSPSQLLVADFLPDRLLRRVEDLSSAFLGALVFDKWTCNCDGRQMIFHRSAKIDGAPYSVAMIDQGYCFNDGDWSFPDSPLRGIYPRRIVYESVTGLESFEPFLTRVENFSIEELLQCTSGIPVEWCEPHPSQLGNLIEILHSRRRKLRQDLIDVKNSPLDPFPNWR